MNKLNNWSNEFNPNLRAKDDIFNKLDKEEYEEKLGLIKLVKESLQIYKDDFHLPSYYHKLYEMTPRELVDLHIRIKINSAIKDEILKKKCNKCNYRADIIDTKTNLKSCLMCINWREKYVQV